MKDRLGEQHFVEKEPVAASLSSRKRAGVKLKKEKINKADVWKSAYFLPHLPIVFLCEEYF